MTISNQTTKVTASGNGVATVFSFSPMVIYGPDDLLVTVVTAAGVETVISRGASSSTYFQGVTAFPGTGTITYPAVGGTPLPTGSKIIMKRLLVLEQPTNLENQGGYLPEVQETQLDKIVAQNLQQQEALDRAIKLKISYTGADNLDSIPTPIPEYYLRWNAAGTGFEFATAVGPTGPAGADGILPWAAGAGAADAITATYSPAIVTLTDGMLLRVRALSANVTTTPTFSPNGLTARTIVKTGGVALVAGDISGANHELVLVYRAAATQWELINPDYKTLTNWLSTRASAVVRTFTDLFIDRNSVMDFIPLVERVKIRLRTSTVDLSTYFAAAAATGTEVLVPDGLYHVSAFTMATAGAAFVGQGAGTVIRSFNAAVNMITLAADDLRIERLRLEGAATSAASATFAVFSEAAAPAKRAKLIDLVVSGADSTKGFNNFAKFDTACDHPEVRGCYVERMWGTASGFGYGVLFGAVNAPRVYSNTFIATPNRGRHAVYLSAGTSYGRVLQNYVQGFSYEGITVFATDAQPVGLDNIIAFNSIVGCATAGGLSNSSISLFTNVQECTIAYNRIKSSGGCGILCDGTGSTNLKNNRIIGNQVYESAFMGIDIKALQGFDLLSNHVRESSQDAVGTYPNIRLVSDTTTATKDGLVALNRSHGVNFARSAFQCNTTAPVPSNIKVSGNQFETCNLIDIELGTSVVAVDGRIRAAIGAFNPPSIANNSSYSTTVTVTGAVVGDVVTGSHAVADFNGCAYSFGVTAADTVSVSIVNNSGGAKDLLSATLFLDVWKRIP